MILYKNYNNVEVTEYKFETYQIIRTETSYPFWRIVLTIRRIYTGLRNTLLFCYNFCWNNSFGLKALWSSKILKDYYLDKFIHLTNSLLTTEHYTYQDIHDAQLKQALQDLYMTSNEKLVKFLFIIFDKLFNLMIIFSHNTVSF